MISIQEMAVFCKRKGFVYLNSEIYGGLAGFFDYGPLGVELKNNIKQEWWKKHVHEREDIVGIDGCIITNAKVWEASGHVSSFQDIFLECKKCHERVRADEYIEEKLKIKVEGLKPEDIDIIVKENTLRCPKCKGEFERAKPFNLMFKTFVGPAEDYLTYLRPETAQLIFVDFKDVVENARLKLPFGIAQVGKVFRNEISPRNFLFRCREFEQMEIEYFVNPYEKENCPYLKDFENYKLKVLTADMQKKNQGEKEMIIKDVIKKRLLNQWHIYWLAFEHKFFVDLGVNPENLRIRQHTKEELAHYSKDCWDLEYKFPFGWKELQGIADREDFDLRQHIKYSKKDLSIYDEKRKKKIVPHVIAEPSLGVDRAFLVFMFEAYNYDKKRENIVLRLHPKLAPIKLGIFPLVNKLENQAHEIYKKLRTKFVCYFDKSGSIGRRYARADESGVPYCITIDFDTAKDKSVTIRDRDTTKQIRVKLKELENVLEKLIKKEVKFEKAGKVVYEGE